MPKYQRRKPEYIEKAEYYEFKGHMMIKLPIKVNPNTGYGEACSIGVNKAKAFIDNVDTLRQFVLENKDQLKTIKADAHLKGE